MHYQVGYHEIFNPIIAHLPYIGLIGIVLLFMLYKEKKDKKVHVKIGLFILIVSISIIAISLASEVGSGWNLEGNNQLQVKAFETRTIQLSDSKIDLVDSKGQWQLVSKRVGYNSSDLNIGFFFLQNGKSAIVFQHLTSPKMLLIIANNEYIVLSHPGIETLYNELLNRGVRRITQ